MKRKKRKGEQKKIRKEKRRKGKIEDPQEQERVYHHQQTQL